MQTYQLPTFTDWDLKIYAGSFEVLLEWLQLQLGRSSANGVSQSKPLVIMTPNPEIVMQSRENPKLLSALQSADVLIPDGTGLVWVSKWQGRRGKQLVVSQSTTVTSIQERVTGVDVVSALFSNPKVAQLKILVIGGRGLGVDHEPPVARSAAVASNAQSSSQTDAVNDAMEDKLSQLGGCRLAPLIISADLARAYWLEGYGDVAQPSVDEESAIRSVLSTLQPDLVFVAFGAPHQEIWIANHLGLLRKNHTRLVMSVGGSFDILTGHLQRAPQWMQTMGLEWLARLIQEPHRLKRQLRWVQFALGALVAH